MASKLRKKRSIRCTIYFVLRKEALHEIQIFSRREVAHFYAHDNASTMVRIKLQPLRNITVIGRILTEMKGRYICSVLKTSRGTPCTTRHMIHGKFYSLDIYHIFSRSYCPSLSSPVLVLGCQVKAQWNIYGNIGAFTAGEDCFFSMRHLPRKRFFTVVRHCINTRSTKVRFTVYAGVQMANPWWPTHIFTVLRLIKVGTDNTDRIFGWRQKYSRELKKKRKIIYNEANTFSRTIVERSTFWRNNIMEFMFRALVTIVK